MPVVAHLNYPLNSLDMGAFFSRLPRIEYPVAREFENELFNNITYVVSFLVLVLLTIINTAAVGYDPTVVLSSDFNATQSFWYHAFIRPPAPGTLCDPRVFNVGESLVTNASVFEWKILAITRPNAGKSGVAYEGGTVNNCDVAQMSFYGDLHTWSLEIVAYAACRDSSDLEVIAFTSFSLSPLPGRRGLILRRVQTDAKSELLDDLFIRATDDTGFRAWNAFLGSNRTGAVTISLSADVEYCPPSKGFINGAAQRCAIEPPKLNLTAANVINADLDLHQDGSFSGHSFLNPEPLVLDDVLTPPITNILQLALAAIRIDLGNPAPNNLLTHPEVLNRTLVSVFPETPTTPAASSMLYSTLRSRVLRANMLNPSNRAPFSVPGPSTIQAVFVCKVMKRKRTGNLIITVFVATAGMFASGWAVFIYVARYLVEARAEHALRRPGPLPIAQTDPDDD